MSPALSTHSDSKTDGDVLSRDEKAVRLLILNAFEYIRSDDFDRYFDLFSEDAIWMMPSSNRDVGLIEAKSFYGFTKKFRFDQSTSVEELVVADDIAFARVGFDGYLRSRVDQNAPPLRSVSRHLWIMNKQLDGSWKISRDIWNTPKNKS